jgi:hypothetical protein
VSDERFAIANEMIQRIISSEERCELGRAAGGSPKKPGKRRNLGTFKSRKAAEKHEREVQYFKRH